MYYSLLITPSSKQPNRTYSPCCDCCSCLRCSLLWNRLLLLLLDPLTWTFTKGTAAVTGAVAARHYNYKTLAVIFCACATTAVTVVATTLLSPSDANARSTTKGGSVNFSNVKDGDTVPSTFTYEFAVTGLELSPAKDGLLPGTGHHHVIIDDPKGFVAKGIAIPFDATHKHYGKAQTEGEIELEKGTHTITLQFANALHESYGKDFAKTITVTVL